MSAARDRAAVGRLVDRRLAELLERHRVVEAGAVENLYEPGRGYRPPSRAGAAGETFAISLASLDGAVRSAGDDEQPFALQSVSKVFAYALALEDNGRAAVMARVGVEPSGDAFNSIVFDERNQRPHNPMVNAGALVTSDLVRGADADEKLARIVDLMRACAANDELAVDEDVFERELRSADHNRATAYLMRSLGMLDGDVEEILALYLRQCSVAVTCRDLSVMAATLAGAGVNPVSGERVLSRPRTRDVLSVMYTCGMYDFAGEWAFDVGFPAKSGVSGDLLAAIPGKLGIAVFSPGLDAYGNSVRGTRVCEDISGRLGLHVFAAEEEDAMLRPGPERG